MKKSHEILEKIEFFELFSSKLSLSSKCMSDA